MHRNRIFISIGLIALAILIAMSGAFFYPVTHEIIVPIDRSALDFENPNPIKSLPPQAVKTDSVQSLALRPAPDPRLIEKSRFGLLPRKSETGEKPSDLYARPFPIVQKAESLSQLSIVVLHAGMHETLTMEAYLALPPDVSFSVSPYANDADRQVRDIRNRGHEVFLEVQSKADASSHLDRGPYALDPEKGQDGNRDSLYWMMARFPGYVGIIADLTSMAAQNATLTNLIEAETSSRGLAYFKLTRDETERDSGEMKPDAGSIIILPGRNPTELATALEMVLKRTHESRQLIAFIDPAPLALDRLKDWIVKHQSHEFNLVPLSALMRAKGQG